MTGIEKTRCAFGTCAITTQHSGIAIAPIFVIWFGIGWVSKLTLVFLLCFFPMLVNNVAGFRGINPEIMDFARSTGANSWRLFWRMPAA